MFNSLRISCVFQCSTEEIPTFKWSYSELYQRFGDAFCLQLRGDLFLK